MALQGINGIELQATVPPILEGVQPSTGSLSEAVAEVSDVQKRLSALGIADIHWPGKGLEERPSFTVSDVERHTAEIERIMNQRRRSMVPTIIETTATRVEPRRIEG